MTSYAEDRKAQIYMDELMTEALKYCDSIGFSMDGKTFLVRGGYVEGCWVVTSGITVVSALKKLVKILKRDAKSG